MFNGFCTIMENRAFFKARRIPSLAESLAKRCQNVIAERQEKRREFFWSAVVSENVSTSNKTKEIEKKKNTRAEMLKKWKAEKIKKLEEAKKKQKPIFKVGVVQRKVTGSPLYSHQKTYASNLSNLVRNESHIKLQNMDSKEKRAGVLTRAKAQKLNIKITETQGTVSTTNKIETKFNNKFYKIDNSKKQKINSHVFKVPEAVAKLPSTSLTFPYSPKLMRKNKRLVVTKDKKGEVTPAESETEQKENLPKESSVKTIVEESPVRTFENANSEQDYFRPIYYSPFVTVRSGKKTSGRKSKKKLMLNVDEEILKEEKEFECRIFSFRKFIECESKRLMDLCDKWKHIYKELEELPPDIEGDIDSVVGKTNLLTSDKFNQFKGLIEKCECGDPFVKVDDLQGFQDWVALEVEHIDNEFHRLESRKNNGWEQPQQPEQQKQPAKTKKTAKNTSKKPVGRSNIRAHIMAARKLLKEGNVNGIEKSEPSKGSLGDVEMTKTPTREPSLLKKVLSSDIKKKGGSSGKKSPIVRERRNSGLEIMIATQKNKFPTPLKVQKPLGANDFEVFFGVENTPNKSILKKTPKACSALKGSVTFKRTSQSGGSGGRGGGGLSEKYFRVLTDWDDSPVSPMRTVLGDLANLSSGGMRTRSRTRQLSQSSLFSPQVK